MIYLMRIWAGLIAFVFVLIASVITITIAFVSTSVLFACALVATPFLFFTSNAAAALERITQIVVFPLRFGGETVADLWSQLRNIITGRSASHEAESSITLTARVALMLAFSASCLTAIAIAPITGEWKALAFTLTGFVLVSILSVAAMIGWDNDYVVRVGTVVILIAFTVAGVVTTILAKLSPHAKGDIILGEVFGLIVIWAITLIAVWNAT